MKNQWECVSSVMSIHMRVLALLCYFSHKFDSSYYKTLVESAITAVNEYTENKATNAGNNYVKEFTKAQFAFYGTLLSKGGPVFEPPPKPDAPYVVQNAADMYVLLRFMQRDRVALSNATIEADACDSNAHDALKTVTYVKYIEEVLGDDLTVDHGAASVGGRRKNKKKKTGDRKIGAKYAHYKRQIARLFPVPAAMGGAPPFCEELSRDFPIVVTPHDVGYHRRLLEDNVKQLNTPLAPDARECVAAVLSIHRSVLTLLCYFVHMQAEFKTLLDRVFQAVDAYTGAATATENEYALSVMAFTRDNFAFYKRMVPCTRLGLMHQYSGTCWMNSLLNGIISCDPLRKIYLTIIEEHLNSPGVRVAFKQSILTPLTECDTCSIMAERLYNILYQRIKGDPMTSISSDVFAKCAAVINVNSLVLGVGVRSEEFRIFQLFSSLHSSNFFMMRYDSSDTQDVIRIKNRVEDDLLVTYKTECLITTGKTHHVTYVPTPPIEQFETKYQVLILFTPFSYENTPGIKKYDTFVKDIFPSLRSDGKPLFQTVTIQGVRFELMFVLILTQFADNTGHATIGIKCNDNYYVYDSGLNVYIMYDWTQSLTTLPLYENRDHSSFINAFIYARQH